MTRSPRLTRRRALVAAVQGLGVAGMTPWLPGCAGRADARVTPALLRSRIDTVVVLMMENRSFDHMLGSLTLAEGRTDVDGLVATMANADLGGAPVLVHPADQSCIFDPPHGWTSSHDQFNGGANDGFVQAHAARHGTAEAHRVMGFFDRGKLSSTYALADRYATCERWFASVMGPTWPNRFYATSATSVGLQGNEFPPEPFDTIFDRVDRQRTFALSWKDYYGNLPFNVALPHRSLDDAELVHLEDFFTDAEAGTLPSLSWIEPLYGHNDNHPPTHPVAGEILISSIYEALARSPQWGRCLLVVTYDEHGGFFDHVPPPKAADERAAAGFDQLGFRVPTIVVGPYVRQGLVSDTVFDHTSTLAFLERLWDLAPLSARDAAATDLTELLDPQRLLDGTPAEPITLPVIEADDAEIHAPACDGGFLHRAPGATITGQAELEAYVDARWPAGHPKDRRARSAEVYEGLLARAAALGVLRRR